MPKSPTAKSKYASVDAHPEKSFFVEMLTRDISLDAAILDLLDNCVDGVLRSHGQSSGKTPYSGYKAEIRFDKNSFSIVDNCGGIPWSLHSYAFRLGSSKGTDKRPPGSVGTYGIGMKRAIFKMGKQCLIETKSGRDAYNVEIQSDWLDDDDDWRFPAHESTNKLGVDGTTIVIDSLHAGVSASFGKDQASFTKNLHDAISTYYAFIIQKGFQVLLNGERIDAKPIDLVFAEGSSKSRGVRPFLYKSEIDGVKVFLAVGFTQAIPSHDELSQDQEGARYSSLDAGWTVVCNDRAVLYCDKTARTGWGEAGVPKYHQQFIAISGIVEFRSADPRKLPTTTTKQGVDQDSLLYLEVKNKMREGMKIFTDFTNKWKEDIHAAKKAIEGGKSLSFTEIQHKAKKLEFRSLGSGRGAQFKPKLPQPKPKGESRISFTRSDEEIEMVANYLLGSSDATPKEVGIGCFEKVLKDAKK